MNKSDRPHRDPPHPLTAVRRATWVFILIGLVLIYILVPRAAHREPEKPLTAQIGAKSVTSAVLPQVQPARRTQAPDSAPTLTAEQIVCAKVAEFARSRRRIAFAIGRRLNKEVPAELEKFFDAIESGQWEEIKAQWEPLAHQSGQYEHATHSEDLDPFWPAVLDAYGVAEQAHLWPAKNLLDYGNSILNSLRPGMVYVGGTDDGRWIPELLNETSGNEQHIIVTQNALADGRYLDWVNTLYSDQMATLTGEDSQAAFQEYVADAQKRLQHDLQFPDEPKQVRPGEDIQLVDGKAQVSGQVAVMAINERLLQTLMQKNPNLSFAIQESLPLQGTYPDARPLGPLMELGVRNDQTGFNSEVAAQSLQYWQSTAQQVLADPESANSPSALKSYSHDAVSAANLLAAHNFPEEAEQGYRVATQLWPENPESVSGLADVLVSTGREPEARQLLEDFTRQHPDQRKDLERTSAYWRLIMPAQSAAH